MMSSLYPPSPRDVPVELTEPSGRQHQQIVLLLLSLALFFLVYVGLLAGCLLLLVSTVVSVAWAIHQPALWRLAAVQLFFCLPALLLFIYLLKNLFHFGGREKTDYVEIFADDQPRLFDFIYRVCDETGAPYPRRVYVNYAVNAMAFSDGASFWQRFVPTGKNLLIGLGLVNSINLTEFKALLAHEFGHFSQKSTKLGVYAYTVFGIINQIVEGRDGFDRFIEGWCQLDPRLAWPAYILSSVLFILRHLLSGLRYAIFFFHQGLSRQLEFNADLVAVSVAGSDAPVHLLYRCSFADRCLSQSIHDLHAARDHRLYTADLFYHQSHAATYLRRRDKQPNLGEPPALPADPTQTTRVFDPDDDQLADMWATHPSNHERERNAKQVYIRSQFDERSPWLLFDDVEQLRADVTYKFYRVHCGAKRELVQAPAAEVQAFIDAERAETSYDARYQGLYDYRTLELEGLDELAQAARQSPWPSAELGDAYAGLYDVEVKHRGQLHNKRLDERNLLTAVARGWHKPKNNELDFRGVRYGPDDAKRLLKKVEKELEQDRVWLAAVDRRVFLTHYQLALALADGSAAELLERYRFHRELQSIWRQLKDQQAPVGAAVQFLQTLRSNQLERALFQQALAIFRDSHRALRAALIRSEELTIPALKNMPAGKSLRAFLLSKRLVDGLSEYEESLNPRWINKLLDQLRQVQQKVDRLHFKSLGGILALQERIGESWVRRRERGETSDAG